MSRGQISAEFIIFLGLAFMTALFFELASLDQLKDFRIKKESEAMNDLALKLQREILLAATVEDGYVRTFSVPQTIDNMNFTLATQNLSIIVQSRNSYFMMPIPTAAGNLSKGANTINKTGGVIHIN